MKYLLALASVALFAIGCVSPDTDMGAITSYQNPMSAPTPPSTNYPWAATANYPAGTYAWSGQPIKVDASDSKFTPARSLPATNLNKILNDRDTYLSAVAARVEAIHTTVVAAEYAGGVSATAAGADVRSLDVPGLLAGDIMAIQVSGQMSSTMSGSKPLVWLNVHDPGGSITLEDTTRAAGSDDTIAAIYDHYNTSCFHTVATAGTGAVKVHLSSSGGDAVGMSSIQIIVTIHRAG